MQQHETTRKRSVAGNVIRGSLGWEMKKSVRGLQYLAPPAMIQTGAIPRHPAALSAYGRLHG
jgi:hypothetical protein